MKATSIYWLLSVAISMSTLKGQSAGIHDPRPFSPLGKWRAVFQYPDGQHVPFNFDIEDSAGTRKLFFLNAEERFGSGGVRLTGDSVFVTLDPFENELALGIKGDSLKGVLRRLDKSGTPLPVSAARDKGFRFPEPASKPAGDLSGTYEVSFINPRGGEEKTVGLFIQHGNRLRATFLRVTGDSRFLEGVVDGNNFYLSSFIGSGPAYYKGQFTTDGKISGDIIGPHGSQHFTGNANEAAALPDGYSLTTLKDGYSALDFSFPDANGRPISLKDAKYKNKVVVVTITGSWCPNCIDEACFLSPFYHLNRNRGIEIISIHYERQTDTAYVRRALTRFKNRFGIEYDQVIGGIADKQQVAASLPALNAFLAFPTTIFIDRQGKVAKIHTGFSGPATGKYYGEFVTEFNTEIDNLLKQ